MCGGNNLYAWRQMEMSEFKNKHKNTSGHLIRVITHMELAGKLSYIGLTNLKKIYGVKCAQRIYNN